MIHHKEDGESPAPEIPIALAVPPPVMLTTGRTVEEILNTANRSKVIIVFNDKVYLSFA